jgi:C1A family cysteine protease
MEEDAMEHAAEKFGMGWLPDYPDFRDYTAGEKGPVKPLLAKVGVAKRAKANLPASADLRSWCSPVENQESLGSCTANAAAGLIEYFERRAFGKHLDASRLFLYKATRNMLHWTGDTGAFLRSTMGALVLFGVPPEEYWPYTVAAFDQEPPAFCYAFAQNYQAISYYRLDPPGTAPSSLVNAIKTNLAGGLPSIFGFTVYGSYTQAATTGLMPYPTPGEKIVGGHAVLAVGYDDKLKIKNTNPNGIETKGALLIRNSWGTGWGSGGYGWLPYDYVLKGLAVDWWSLIKSEWVDTGAFKL